MKIVKFIYVTLTNIFTIIGSFRSCNIDYYFDKHDISFGENGKILLGKRVDDEIKKIYKNFSLDEKVLTDKRKKYLKFHRKNLMINKVTYSLEWLR